MSMETKTESSEFRGERSTKFLKASKIMSEFQKQHHQEMKERAARGEPVVWANVEVPTELIHAMDIPVLFNVNWSAIIAAKQMAAHYLDVLNARGYFRDLCRYCALPLGYFFEGERGEAPWGGVPKPAAIIGAAMDDPVIKIYELMGKELNVPVHIFDQGVAGEPPRTSFCETVEDIEAESYREGWRVDYAVKELEELISFLERVTGKTLSRAKLREVMERSNEQFDYIGEMMDLCATVPAPISMGDHMPNLVITQFFKGHEFGLAQAKRLYEEVKERVENGLAACENERIRLMWLGVPFWFSPGFYEAFEEQYGAVFAWPGYFAIPRLLIRRDLSDPLRALAARYVYYCQNGLLPPWIIQWYIYYAKQFKIDGAIFPVAESCRILSGPRLLAMRALEEIGVATCQLEADMVDVRDWDDAKMKAKVGSFLETILERK